MKLNGKVVFENNMEVKEKFMDSLIEKGKYNSANNLIFEVFYL